LKPASQHHFNDQDADKKESKVDIKKDNWIEIKEGGQKGR